MGILWEGCEISLISDVKRGRSYQEMKEDAQDCEKWRKLG
jgi:hypothetical protein